MVLLKFVFGIEQKQVGAYEYSKCAFYVVKDADRLPQNLHSLLEKNETMK